MVDDDPAGVMRRQDLRQNRAHVVVVADAQRHRLATLAASELVAAARPPSSPTQRSAFSGERLKTRAHARPGPGGRPWDSP